MFATHLSVAIVTGSNKGKIMERLTGLSSKLIGVVKGLAAHGVQAIKTVTPTDQSVELFSVIFAAYYREGDFHLKVEVEVTQDGPNMATVEVTFTFASADPMVGTESAVDEAYLGTLASEIAEYLRNVVDLRLIPGLIVARIDSGQIAVSVEWTDPK